MINEYVLCPTTSALNHVDSFKSRISLRVLLNEDLELA